MGCTLGRITGLESPKTIRQDGDRLRLAGEFATTPTAGAVLAQQLVGYPSPDEEVVPFTYDASESGGVLDGFYFVTSTQVDWAKLASGLFSWEAELVAVPSNFQVHALGATRANDHAISLLTGWNTVPNSSLVHSLRNSAMGTSSLVGGGTVIYTRSSAYLDGSATFEIDPADAYEGSPTLTVGGNVATGRRIDNDPDGWVLSNGLIKVRPSLTEANHLVVGVRNSGATNYDEKAYRLVVHNTHTYEMGYNGTTRTGWSSVAVLRNDPVAVSIRVAGALSSGYRIDAAGTLGGPSEVYLDLTIRRGSFYVEARLTDISTAGALNWGVFRATTEAGTSITGGVEASSADASSNKYRIYFPESVTVNTTYGGAYLSTNATTMDFGIGNDRAIYGVATTASEHYFALMDHHQEVVAR